MARKDTMDDDAMNPRTCIVTREEGDADALIRFVAAPDGTVTPDLKRRLPGRGVWVTAKKSIVETAVKRGLFARTLKSEAKAGETLADDVDRLLEASALSALALAKKAGLVITGFAKVDGNVRQGNVFLLLHGTDAAADGIRKLGQGVHNVEEAKRPVVRSVFSSDQMDLALGGQNVIHAAALHGGASKALLKMIERLEHYRS